MPRHEQRVREHGWLLGQDASGYPNDRANVAAFMLEPIQGEAGVVLPADGCAGGTGVSGGVRGLRPRAAAVCGRCCSSRTASSKEAAASAGSRRERSARAARTSPSTQQ